MQKNALWEICNKVKSTVLVRGASVVNCLLPSFFQAFSKSNYELKIQNLKTQMDITIKEKDELEVAFFNPSCALFYVWETMLIDGMKAIFGVLHCWLFSHIILYLMHWNSIGSLHAKSNL